ncbi:MAG: hypothetical protein QXI33_00040 [Candidatus Pacearchaeota archaeon]
MAKYRCNHCNYIFASERKEPPNLCPHCGEIGYIEREKTAEDLIKDVTSIFDKNER